MPKKRVNLQPASTLESQATKRFNMNEKTMGPRQFRDALTKVTGGVRGVPTQAVQWNRNAK